jgi:hypothetical protein
MDSMSHRPTTIERAYDLAKSGEYATVGAIKDQLKREGFSDIAGQLYGPTIQRALRELCTASQAQPPHEQQKAG